MTRDSHPGTVPDIVSDDQVKILLAALYHAADYKRERAETCADCGDQSCITCRGGGGGAPAPPRLRQDGRPDEGGRRGLRHPAAQAPPCGACHRRAACGRESED